jgi:hypothetical protein
MPSATGASLRIPHRVRRRRHHPSARAAGCLIGYNLCFLAVRDGLYNPWLVRPWVHGPKLLEYLPSSSSYSAAAAAACANQGAFLFLPHDDEGLELCSRTCHEVMEELDEIEARLRMLDGEYTKGAFSPDSHLAYWTSVAVSTDVTSDGETAVPFSCTDEIASAVAVFVLSIALMRYLGFCFWRTY